MHVSSLVGTHFLSCLCVHSLPVQIWSKSPPAQASMSQDGVVASRLRGLRGGARDAEAQDAGADVGSTQEPWSNLVMSPSEVPRPMFQGPQVNLG